MSTPILKTRQRMRNSGNSQSIQIGDLNIIRWCKAFVVREGDGRWEVMRCHPGYRRPLGRGDTLKMALTASNITIGQPPH